MNHRSTFRRLAGLLLLAAAFTVAACGGDDGGSSSGSGSGGSGTASSGGACASQARDEVAKYTAETPLQLPDKPLDTAKLRGKALHFISVVNNEFAVALEEGWTDAVKAMGAKSVIFDAKGQAARFGTGVQQAIDQDADGIVLFGIDPSAVSKQIEDAVAKDIPIVDVYNGQPDAPLPDGVLQHVSADYERSATALSNWMLADSGCKAKAVLFEAPVIKLYAPFAEVEPQVFKAACASDCSFKTQDVDLATFATKLGPQVSNYVRANPDTNYVQVAFDSMITFVEPALAQAGGNVKLLGHDGTGSVLDAIRKDSGPTKVTMAFPPEKWIGWDIADTIAREVAGSDAVDTTIPTRLVDKSNVGGSNADVFPAYQGFEEKWQAAWKAGS